MISNKWIAPLVLMLAVAGSLSACNSDGAPEAAKAMQDDIEPVAQSRNATSAQTFNMTITGDVQADVTGVGLTDPLVCPNFDAYSMGGDPITVDMWSNVFYFMHGGKEWTLDINIDHGAPGTVSVTSYDAEVVLVPKDEGREAAYWDEVSPIGNSSGTITISEDGQSGSLDVKNLVRPTPDGSGPTVNIQGSWSC